MNAGLCGFGFFFLGGGGGGEWGVFGRVIHYSFIYFLFHCSFTNTENEFASRALRPLPRGLVVCVPGETVPH